MTQRIGALTVKHLLRRLRYLLFIQYVSLFGMVRSGHFNMFRIAPDT